MITTSNSIAKVFGKNEGTKKNRKFINYIFVYEEYQIIKSIINPGKVRLSDNHPRIKESSTMK